MNAARLVLAILLLITVGPGCGGVDEPAVNAPEKCETLRAVYCGRLVACEAGALTNAQCVAAFSSGLDCGRAVGITASYDRCLAELPAWECTVFDHGRNLPASCNGAITVGP